LVCGVLLTLSQDAIPTPYAKYTVMRGASSQKITGMLVVGQQTWVRVTAIRPNDTLYVAVTGDNGLVPFLRLTNNTQTLDFAQEDNADGDNIAFMEYVITGESEMLLILETRTNGNYTLEVGINTPSVLTNVGAGKKFYCNDSFVSERPQLSGAVQTLEAPNTIIHYTTEGEDATTSAYIMTLNDALQNSLSVQFDQLGWAKPPIDCGAGGDDRLDVYVINLDDGTLGYARPERIIGDNPNTPPFELSGAYSYLVIENDMDIIPREFATLYLQVTVAHEVHHNIQFGYNTDNTFYGIYESGAVWVETLVYPDLSDAYNYTDVFMYPDLCLGTRNTDTPTRIYGEWVMMDSISQDFGMSSYQQIWQNMALGRGMNGFYNALDMLGTTPESVIQRMAIRNLLHDFARGNLLDSTVVLENILTDIGDYEGRVNGVQEQSVDYVQIGLKGLYYFAVQRGDNIALTLVGINTANKTATVYELGKGGTVDTTPFDYAYLIVQNTTRHTDPETCNFTNWQVYVGKGDDLPRNDSTGEVWDATFFEPPN
jgi:hypothetical protein